MDSDGTWLYAGTTTDGKPIIMQQLDPVDAEIRAYIVRNTTGSDVPSEIRPSVPHRNEGNTVYEICCGQHDVGIAFFWEDAA